MIKFKEIPIGELNKELLSKQFVYCKYKDNPLVKVNQKSNLELGEIQDAKFYVEDTSEGVSELTWGEIFKEFIKQHIALEPLIDEYRPSTIAPFTIKLWTKAPFNTEFVVTYNPLTKTFSWRDI